MTRDIDRFIGVGAAAIYAGMLTILPVAPAQAADSVPLAAHRAVYDLSLAQTRGKAAMQSVRGRILYDFTGNVCEGYALNFRQVTELDSGEGKRAVSDLRSTNWEEGAGKSFRFTTQNFLDTREVDNAEGRAERAEEKVTITLTRPEPKRLEIGDVVFPSDHMRRIIIAARAGKSLLEIGTYDGAENGERVYNSLTVIGQVIAPGERLPADAAGGEQAQQVLSKLARWPVTISYFDRSKAGGDQTPAYAISFELYDNGVARAIKIDYGDFVLNGALSALEIKDAKPCP